MTTHPNSQPQETLKGMVCSMRGGYSEGFGARKCFDLTLLPLFLCCCLARFWRLRWKSSSNVTSPIQASASKRRSLKTIRTRSTTTRERNLQFSGTFLPWIKKKTIDVCFSNASLPFSPGCLCKCILAISKDIAPNARLPGREKSKHRILSRLWLSWFFSVPRERESYRREDHQGKIMVLSDLDPDSFVFSVRQCSYFRAVFSTPTPNVCRSSIWFWVGEVNPY